MTEKGVGTNSLLESISTITIPATAGQFVARERFVVDTSKEAELQISYLGSNFKKWFLDKVEESADENTLRCQRLRWPEVDGPIIAELGGENKAETSLSELYTFLKQAGRNEWFIFYVCDKNGLLRAVYAYWDGGGWRVYAGSVESPCGWRGGFQVVSPNS